MHLWSSVGFFPLARLFRQSLVWLQLSHHSLPILGTNPFITRRFIQYCHRRLYPLSNGSSASTATVQPSESALDVLGNWFDIETARFNSTARSRSDSAAATAKLPENVDAPCCPVGEDVLDEYCSLVTFITLLPFVKCHIVGLLLHSRYCLSTLGQRHYSC